jgi:hypothetical protein
MNTLLKRLKRLEQACGVDSSGYAPHSPQWKEYWFRRLESYAKGDSHQVFPIEVIRAWIQNPPSEDVE